MKAFYLAINHQLMEIILPSNYFYHSNPISPQLYLFIWFQIPKRIKVWSISQPSNFTSQCSCLRSHHIWGFGQFLVQGCLLWLPNRRIRLLRVGCYREVWSLHADKPGLLWSVEFLNTLTVFLILSLFCVIWFNWPCILWSWALTNPLSPPCHFHTEWTIKLSANINHLKLCGHCIVALSF